MIGIFKEAVRMLLRRKSRVIPALCAVSSGIFLLIVTASVSAYFMELSSGLIDSFKGKAFLCEKKNFWIGGGLIPEEKISSLRTIENIGILIPMLISRAEADDIVVMGIPDIIVGIPLELCHFYVNASALLEGKFPESPDEVVIGWDIAKNRRLKIGEEIELKCGKFKVSGITKKTSSILDKQIIASLSEMQRLLERKELLTCIMAIPSKENAIEKISEEVKSKTGYIQTISSRYIEKEIAQTVSFWNALTIVFFLISGLGSLASVSAVTAMAVTERKIEIAVKKAIGAKNKDIYIEYLSESLIITCVAWITALVFALAFILFCESFPWTSNAAGFSITPFILFFSLLWSVLIAAAASYLPLRDILSESPAVLLRS